MSDYQDVYIFNALDKNVKFKALGNHFDMKPRQIKRFNADMGNWIAKERGYYGLVAIDIRFEEPEFKLSEEGQALLEEARLEGVRKRAAHLKMNYDNDVISVSQDLNMMDMKIDPLSLLSDGAIENMKELQSIQRQSNDREKIRLETARALSRSLAANANAQANKKAD